MSIDWMRENRNIKAKAVLFTVNKVSCLVLNCVRFGRMWWACEDYNRPSALVRYCYVWLRRHAQTAEETTRSFELAITRTWRSGEWKQKKKKWKIWICREGAQAQRTFTILQSMPSASTERQYILLFRPLRIPSHYGGGNTLCFQWHIIKIENCAGVPEMTERMEESKGKHTSKIQSTKSCTIWFSLCRFCAICFSFRSNIFLRIERK